MSEPHQLIASFNRNSMFFITSIVLAIIAVTQATTPLPRVVVRPNIGTVFIKDRDVTLSPIVWHHTVAVPFFPDLQDLQSSPVCSPGHQLHPSVNRTCALIAELHDVYTQVASQLQSDISATHTSIQDAMSLTQQHHRSKRGWFNLLGNIAKKVMGVATTQDIKILQGHIAELAIMLKEKSKNRIHDVSKLHSYEIKLDHRMDRLSKHLVSLDNTLMSMSHDVEQLKKYAEYTNSISARVYSNSRLLNTTFKIFNWLHSYNLNIHGLAQLRTTAVSQLATVAQLAQGRLAAEILAPQHLKDIIKDINIRLAAHSPNLVITTDPLQFYRQEDLITVTHDVKYLYVKIRFPVSSPSSQFSLYKVDTVPVPTDQTTEVFTQLSGLPDWLAISSDASSFIPFHHDEAAQLKEILNTQNYLPIQVTNQSCVLNLFFGLQEDIILTCRHQLLKKPQTSLEFVYTLPPRGYLIYTPTRQWSTLCNGTETSDPVNHQGLFFMDVQCGCIVSSHQTNLLPDTQNCSSSQTEIGYSANFLVYQKLYRHLQDFTMNINDFHQEPVNFQLPNIIHEKLNFTDLELQDNLSAQDITDLNNFEAATDLPPQWSYVKWIDHPEADNIIASVCITIAIIQIASIIAIASLFQKIRAIAVTIAALTYIHRTEAVDFLLPTTPPVEAPVEHPDIPLWRTIMMFVSLTLTVVNSIFVIVDKIRPILKKCNTNVQLDRLHTELFCSLYSDSNRMHIKIITIAHPIENITPIAASPIYGVTANTNGFCAFIHIDWRSLQIIANDKRIILPIATQVPMMKYRSLRRLTRTCHSIKITLIQEDKHHVISDWTRRDITPGQPRTLPLPGTVGYDARNQELQQSPLLTSQPASGSFTVSTPRSHQHSDLSSSDSNNSPGLGLSRIEPLRP